MGMLATLINGLALQEALAQREVPALLQSAVSVPWADPVHPRRAREALTDGKIVVFVGGTGNPFVTTDTAAAIRTAEIGAEILLKATQVEGVYTADPKRDPQAKLLKSITYERAIREQLGVIDLAALTLCREHHIPIVVFDFFQQGNLDRVLRREDVGTRISA
jgi:uridylate kinase